MLHERRTSPPEEQLSGAACRLLNPFIKTQPLLTPTILMLESLPGGLVFASFVSFYNDFILPSDLGLYNEAVVIIIIHH